MTMKWQKSFTPINLALTENKYTIQKNKPSSEPID